jgi:hypothetical protein
MLKINPELLRSFPQPTHSLMQEVTKKIALQLNQKREQQFKNRLSELGFTFETQEAFFDFCKNHVQRVFPDKGQMNYSEFYIDFVDNTNKGIFIGSINDEFETSFENNKATFKFGNLQ